MEKFFIPKDKEAFINWLLKTSNDNNWTIVLEYSDDEIYNVLVENAGIVKLPETTERHYNNNSKLTAITNPAINKRFVNDILEQCSVLSVHNQKEMLFLIADNFHEECFSSTRTFFDSYYRVVADLNLIYVKQQNEKTRFEQP